MKIAVTIILLFVCNTLFAQMYHTQPLSNEIHTIQINKNGEWNEYPVINLRGNDKVLLSFDRISEDNAYNRLRYRIIHCDAYWKKSRDIWEIDYLDGFNDNLIDDYAASVNTTVEYNNFELEIPNDDINLKVSGNYAIEVYDDGSPDIVLLTACFSVVDQQISIGATVSSNTDIDSNRSHQQLSFTINHSNLTIRDPRRDLSVFAWQNNRLDTERVNLKPTYINAGKLIYEHNRDLIFEAGNEYRRFETSSYRYNGMNVEHVEYNKPTYSMYIVPDKIRAIRSYSYDQDQNGRFVIRSNDTDYPANEADYFSTIFSIPMDNPIPEDIYINGNFTYNNFTDRYKMVYDEDNKLYYLPLLLKQGLYNYQYLTKSGKNYTTSKIEGNFYETENEYQIFVYHRPPGQRYDSLIGVQSIQSRPK